jgi:hypothetical protein
VAVVANKSCSLPYIVNDDIFYHTLLPEPSPTSPAKTPAVAPNKAASEKPEPPAVTGSWTGTVDTYAGKRPLRLEVSTSREARVTFGNETSQPQELRFGSQSVQGVFTVNLGIDDALPDSRVRLYLDRRNSKLWGTALAYEPRGASSMGCRNGLDFTSRKSSTFVAGQDAKLYGALSRPKRETETRRIPPATRRTNEPA